MRAARALLKPLFTYALGKAAYRQIVKDLFLHLYFRDTFGQCILGGGFSGSQDWSYSEGQAEKRNEQSISKCVHSGEFIHSPDLMQRRNDLDSRIRHSVGFPLGAPILSRIPSCLMIGFPKVSNWSIMMSSEIHLRPVAE